MKHFAIVGAGLTGSLMALNLAQHGYQVSIFDKRSDMRHSTNFNGRSINLALSARGIDALTEVALLDKVLEHAVPIYGRMMHDKSGSTYKQSYGRNNKEHNWAISRATLNMLLLNAMNEYKNISFFFEHELIEYNSLAQQIEFRLATSSTKKLNFDFVIGADGAFSKLRDAMTTQSTCSYQLINEDYGYKELVIDTHHAKPLSSNDLHIWPRSNFMLMSLANPDGSHTLTLYLPHQGDISFESLSDNDKTTSFFTKEFSDIPAMLPNLIEQFNKNPTSNLVYAKVENYYIENKALLIGDAAHAMVPFLGQGMNCGFEDVRLFCQHLDKVGIKSTSIFSTYYNQRKPNTDAIINMALDNYFEMRDAVSRPKFLLQKKIEQAIMQRFPQQYISKYILISYTDTPYLQAMKAGQQQSELLEEISRDINSIDELDWDKVKNLIREF